MLKRDITYEDFNGNRITETFFFNLTKSELVELEAGYDGGLQEAITKIIDAKDFKALILEFKKIVLLSYGIKSEDGKRFIKSDQIREEFAQTAAYDALFTELATDENAAVIFLTGIMPKDLVNQVQAQQPLRPPLPPQSISS